MTSALAAGPQTVTAAGGLQDSFERVYRIDRATLPVTSSLFLEAVEGVEVGLAVASVHSTSLALLGIEVAGPIAGMAAVYVALGNAHADAINSVIKDQIHSGFSRGVVLGADRRRILREISLREALARASHRYPEYGAKFQNAYNLALAAGYAQGKKLTKPESGAFFRISSRMSVHPVSHLRRGLEGVERANLERLLR